MRKRARTFQSSLRDSSTRVMDTSRWAPPESPPRNPELWVSWERAFWLSPECSVASISVQEDGMKSTFETFDHNDSLGFFGLRSGACSSSNPRQANRLAT